MHNLQDELFILLALLYWYNEIRCTLLFLYLDFNPKTIIVASITLHKDIGVNALYVCQIFNTILPTVVLSVAFS